MNSDAIIAVSPNDRQYSARCNHTVAFAKLVNGYAEMYDKWESLTSDARRKREEADRAETEAQKIRLQIEAIARAIRQHMIGKAVGDNLSAA